ncbi:MAG: PAS domain S-box protein [Leptolyngbyaceae cyanobacterium MO_188.B28]|nr:PAS domain S-box protein [Leptolyngbyaceae cyanobacterium MO_188.B28]
MILTQPKPSKGTILIVSDEQTSLSDLLSDYGYTVHALQDEQEALKVVQAAPPDLILLDIPKLLTDGYEVRQSLKTEAHSWEIPIIFIGDPGQTENIKEVFDAGGADYIRCPFQIEEVLARIGHHITLSKLKQRLQAQTELLQQERLQRRQSEAILQDSEERFRATFEQSAVGIAYCTLEGYFTWTNQKFCDIVGYSQDELRSLTYADITHPNDLAVESRYVEAVLDNRLPTYSLEKRYIRQDDSCVWVNLTFSPVRGACGEIKYAAAMVEDISERKQSEAALKASNEQLQAILEVVPGIVSWISSDLRYLGVNQKLAQTFRLPQTAFIDQDIGFLNTSSEFSDFMREFFASPIEDASCEVSARVSGATQNYLIVAKKYDQGRAALTVGIDITERRYAEEALRQTETKYRSIFENAIEGIFQITPEGRYLSANPALAKIYGYDSPEELIESFNSLRRRPYVDANRSAEFAQLLQQQDTVLCFESQVYSRDSQVIWISENARAIRDQTGALLYYEGTVEDITARKKTEAALRQANEELEHKVTQRTTNLRQLNQRLRGMIAEHLATQSTLQETEAEWRTLFAAMPDAISILDAKGRYLKIVSTNTEFLYSPASDRIGKTIYDIFPLEQATLFAIHIQRTLNTGKTVSLEYCLPIKIDNLHQESWFLASISLMPDNRVIWVSRDITELKQQEFSELFGLTR